jgi:hypothetical protein
MAQSHPLVPLAAAAAAAASQRHRPSRASRTSRPAHRRPPCLSCRTSPRSRIPRRARSAPSIRRVRVVPRRIRRGKRARLRLTLSAPARLKIVVERRVRGHRIRVRTLNVDARAGRVSIRLPERGPRPRARARALPRVGRGDRRGRAIARHRAAAPAGPRAGPPTAGSFGPLAATARGGRAASAQSVPDDLAQLRGCGSRWTPQSTIPVPRCWTLPRLGSCDHMTARIHGISAASRAAARARRYAH